MKRGGVGATLLLLAAAAGAGACTAPTTSGGMAGSAGAPGPEGELVPPGHGTLRQEEVSLSLQQGDLMIRVTPLEEWMIRLTAPDTYDRLSELAAAHRPELTRRTGLEEPTLFLVSFFSDQPNTVVDPEDLHLVDRGRRFRPLAIRGVTGGWGTRRLQQRETQMAVYAFDPAVDQGTGLTVQYGDVRNTRWDGVLQILQAELGRARARAAGGS